MRMRYRDKVDVLNAPETTGYGGQKVRDWSPGAVATTSDVPANVYPITTQSGAQEDTDRRQLTITSWRIHVEPGTPLDAESRVEWDGKTLEVNGEVGTFKKRGEPDHLEATLRRTVDA